VKRETVERVILGAAGVVIVALTIGAFWLSYAHLHTVAAEHGLGGSRYRAWAWPGCLDLFIVAGELLLLRASLARRTDWWAVGLVVVGSAGSIALNVLGVDGSDPLAYVTAAVPPTAALLAFGALMQQVHGLVSKLEAVDAPVDALVVTEHSAPSTPAPVIPAPREPLQVEQVDAPVDTEVSTPAAEDADTPERLDPEPAREVIVYGWEHGLSVRETAAAATRSPSFVQKEFTKLERDRGPRPIPGQLALVKAAP
jgi:hypothetical protein